MRDVILTLVFLGILPFALRHTWIGVLLWTWLSVMNPHKLTYGFASSAPFAMAAALVTLASVLINRDKLRLPADATVTFIILFVLWQCLTTFNAILPQSSLTDLITVLKIQLMTVVALMAIRERKQIEAFIWVIVLSVGFYGFKGGLFTIASGGGARVWGPAGTFIEGNNELGLALTMVIPLMNYLRLVSVNKFVRRGLALLMLLSAVSVLGTQSRGALLAIAAMTVVLWLRSSRKLVGGILLVLLSIGLLAFMPDSWEARMRTIGAYQEDSSALQRLNAWGMAVRIANDRITGGGFAIESRSVVSKYADNPDWVFTAHSIYFQALGEQGWIGLVIFMLIGATAFWSTIRIRSASRRQTESLWLFELAGMLQVSMVGYAVGGAFLSLAYLDIAYNIAVIIVAAKVWLRDERWKAEPVGLFNAGQPVGKPKLQGRAHA